MPAEAVEMRVAARTANAVVRMVDKSMKGEIFENGVGRWGGCPSWRVYDTLYLFDPTISFDVCTAPRHNFEHGVSDAHAKYPCDLHVCG